MKIADLVKKKNTKVNVRVPATQQDKLGETIGGTVVGLVPGGTVTMVKVKVPRRGEFTFRPQDLTLA